MLPAALAAAQPAVDVGGDVGVGFDSNPAQSSTGPALAFARIALGASVAHPLGDATLTWDLNGRYVDYEADNDNYRITARVDWARETSAGAGLLGLSAAGAVYRDALVPADARNEASAAIRYSRTVTARDTISAAAEMRWLAYRNASLPWAGRPGSGPESGSGRSRSLAHGNAGRAVAVRRDDRLAGIELSTTHHWSPRVETAVSAVYAHNHSPVPVQGYRRGGIGLSLTLEPFPNWHLDVGFGWSETRYDRAPRRQERVDTQRSIGLAVQRDLGESALFCMLDYLDSGSSIKDRAFDQTVTQCGLAHAF